MALFRIGTVEIFILYDLVLKTATFMLNFVYFSCQYKIIFR